MNVNIYKLDKDRYGNPKLKIENVVKGLSKCVYSAETTSEIIADLIGDSYVEQVYLVCYGATGMINGISRISIGDIGSSETYFRIIATYVLLICTDRFELYHNHPDGQLGVSEDDINLYNSLKTMSNYIGVEFNDSIIVTDKGWYSTKERKGGIFIC